MMRRVKAHTNHVSSKSRASPEHVGPAGFIKFDRPFPPGSQKQLSVGFMVLLC